MSVKVFRVKGYMKLRLGDKQPFTIEVTALRKEHAIEQVLSELGSRHKVTRRHIEIISVQEISPSEVKNPTIRELLSLEKIVQV